jgi:aldose 1-epimerase
MHDVPGLVRLSAGELRLALAPGAGGSIASFTRVWQEGGRERELHWLRPASEEGLATRNPLAMASFPLVPFCNRIRNGRARFEEREIRFPPNHPGEPSPHPLHGIGWLRPWALESATEHEAVLTLHVEASEAWPWAFSARQVYTLQADRLQVEMTLANEDHATMPAGIGHHPYFPHHPGTRITSPTRAMWRADAEVLPTGLEEGGPVPLLREGVELATLDLDNNFIGWERSTRIDWPADAHGPARSLWMEAQPPLDYFVLYCPRGYPFFCAEPVSQCTDWLNLQGQFPAEALGGTRIAPGDALGASFTLRPVLPA